MNTPVIPVKILTNAETEDVLVIVSDEDYERMKTEECPVMFAESDLDLLQRDARLIHFRPESVIVQVSP